MLTECESASDLNCIVCNGNVKGQDCDKCKDGFYNFKREIGECQQPCGCSSFGSSNLACDSQNGSCPCYDNYAGQQCGSCASGYYNYPSCYGHFSKLLFEESLHHLTVISMSSSL